MPLEKALFFVPRFVAFAVLTDGEMRVCVVFAVLTGGEMRMYVVFTKSLAFRRKTEL